MRHVAEVAWRQNIIWQMWQELRNIDDDKTSVEQNSQSTVAGIIAEAVCTSSTLQEASICGSRKPDEGIARTLQMIYR